jgi:hypothetical protein
MDTETGHLAKYVGIFILVLIGIVVSIYLLDQMTGGHIIKSLSCGILYTIPMGSLTSVLTHGCAAIPA